MAKANAYVPILEVGEHTDVVSFGSLGLPVGLDVERITANVPLLERVAHFGNMRKLAITGFQGDVTEECYSVGSVSSNTATAVGAVTIAKADLHAQDVKGNPAFRWGYDWKDATVKINNAEIENRIRNDGDKWDLGLYDPNARVKYMNKALVGGVQAAVRESVFENRGWNELATRVGSLAMIYVEFVALSVVRPHLNPTLFTAITPLIEAGAMHAYAKHKFGDELPKRQWSILNVPQYDRYLAATTLLRTGKVLKLAPAAVDA